MSSPDNQTEARPSRSKKILLIAAIVVGIVGGGGAGVFMAGPLLASKLPAAPVTAGRDTATEPEPEHGEEQDDHAAAAGAPIHLVENMVLNPANSGGSRFLLLSVAFAVRDAAVMKSMTDRDPELRDVILRDLGSRSVDELADITRRDSIKVQLRTAVQQRFGKDAVRDIYFPQFVIQ